MDSVAVAIEPNSVADLDNVVSNEFLDVAQAVELAEESVVDHRSARELDVAATVHKARINKLWERAELNAERP